jgi:hypothetical protein
MKHGHRPSPTRCTPEYTAWREMKRRCYTPGRYFKDYGGRGIRVCPEWVNDFQAFFEHVGRRPSPEHSLDRKNNEGHYEPGNVRWATKAEQSHNTRRSKVSAVDAQFIHHWLSKGHPVKDIASAFGISKVHVYAIRAGHRHCSNGSSVTAPSP